MSLVGAIFTKDASLEFIPAISLKRDSNTEVFSYGFFTITLFKLLEKFSARCLCKTFSDSRKLPTYMLRLYWK